MKIIYYFAYGSNLCTGRLQYRIGKFQTYRVHKLNGYRLVFNCSGFANIEKAKEFDFVEGILYKITNDQLNTLDIIEGFYKKEFFDIENNGIAVVYIGLKEKINNFMKPNLSYLNIILDGLIEHGLKETFNKVCDFKEKNYSLFLGNRHKKFSK